MDVPYYNYDDNSIAQNTAKILMEIGAVNFNTEVPYILTSGWASPAYIDCRKIIYHPRARTEICKMMIKKIDHHIGYDVIEAVAGGETAGIPFSAWIADQMGLPMAYVRKKQKTFGKGSLIEGDVPIGLNTLLVEDLTTDGASKIQFANALRDAGAIVEHAFVVFYYGVFSNCQYELNAMKLKLHHLCEWSDILKYLRIEDKYVTSKILITLEDFLNDPIKWSTENGGRAE